MGYEFMTSETPNIHASSGGPCARTASSTEPASIPASNNSTEPSKSSRSLFQFGFELVDHFPALGGGGNIPRRANDDKVCDASPSDRGEFWVGHLRQKALMNPCGIDSECPTFV